MDLGQKSYPLPLESLPELELEHHISDLILLEEFCSNCGIQTANTRLQRYKDYLCWAAKEKGLKSGEAFFKNTKQHPFESSIDWYLYVLREVHELMWIVKGLKRHMPKGAEEKLRIVVGGSDFAALDSNSQARNFQFELRIASYFCQAGCVVDMSSETDITATIGRFAFFVECKRIGNSSQTRKRLSEAGKQLLLRMPQRHQGKLVFGCVAADITKAAFPHNGLTFAFTSDHAKRVVQEKLLKTVNEIDFKSVFGSCDRLLRCLFQIHIPSLIIHPPTTSTRFSSYCLDNARPGCRRWLAARMLHNIFDVGRIIDPRSIPPESLTLRCHLDLPKGTTFQIDEDLFQQALANRRVYGRKDEDVVARINMNGTETLFSFFELKQRLLRTTQGEWDKWAANSNLARVELIAGMYLIRHPYEERGNRHRA